MQIAMTQFVDFMLSAGTSRVSAVRAAQNPDPSFYAPLLSAITNMHQAGVAPEALDEFLETRLDQRERRLFPKAVAGYKKFLRSARMTWFEPALRDWPLGPIGVRVNPELGLLIDGRPHMIKLYFRGDPLSPPRAMLINHIVAGALQTTWPGTVFAVLDVRRAKLIPYRPKAEMVALLRAESVCLASLAGALP